jgi:hypothetical protein
MNALTGNAQNQPARSIIKSRTLDLHFVKKIKRSSFVMLKRSKNIRDAMSVENHVHDGRESHRDDMLKMRISHAIPPGFLLISNCFSTNRVDCPAG